MTTVEASTPLSRHLAERIRAHGPITFAEYMCECLYHREWGYYSRAETRRFGDFYTSVDVHPIFARLLARQLEEMWHLLGDPAEFAIVEAGAGTGRLAEQILDFAASRLPAFYKALRYVTVEASPARRSAQSVLLAQHLSRGRFTSAAELPTEIPVGVILSNELFDAMPVHRVIFDGGALRESYVAWREGALAEDLGEPSTPALEEYFRAQGVVLREDQQAEVGLDACEWIEDAGRRLGRGFVLTVDYGHWARELYDQWHMRGTLLAYSEHRTNEDFLRAPGSQDLTAHVNFTALDLWGRRQGLNCSGCVSQLAFLVGLGHANDFGDLYDPDASELERVRARLLLKTLIHPEGMGETFQVFIQHKGLEQSPRLSGLAGL